LTSPAEIPVWRGQHVPEAPVVSVCILVVSDHGLIEGCLDSLADSRPSVDTEVVVVANGLGDDELSSLRKRDDIVLVRSAVNAGFSGGNNLAARYARGRYLLLLNDDTVVEAGFIDRLLSAFERDPLIGAVGGTILWPDGTLQEAGSVLWGDGWAAHVGAGFPADSTAYHYVRYVDYLSANGLLVDRHAWDAIGGLDEQYFPAYFEDTDLCLALWDRGYRVSYEPRARLRHLEGQSTSTLFREFLMIRNRAQFVAKWSAVLQNYADHPDPVDGRAVDAAVLRAERSLGRVLVLEVSADATEWHGLPTIEALAMAGWSVMVSVPVDQRRAGSADQAVRDRMVDLGVDVREEQPEDLLSCYGDDLEAVVVSGEGTDIELSLQRADGSSIPLVGQGKDPADSVVARLAAVVRRGVVSSPPIDAHPPKRAVAAHVPSDGVSDPLGGVAEAATVFPVVATTSDASGRDLKFLDTAATVRREYWEYLEYELTGTRAALAKTQAALELSDAYLRSTEQTLEETQGLLKETLAELEEVGTSLVERERYIDSLASVRVKKWVVGRLPNSES
jgi:GT2 family glycosyltransferase